MADSYIDLDSLESLEKSNHLFVPSQSNTHQECYHLISKTLNNLTQVTSEVIKNIILIFYHKNIFVVC